MAIAELAPQIAIALAIVASAIALMREVRKGQAGNATGAHIEGISARIEDLETKVATLVADVAATRTLLADLVARLAAGMASGAAAAHHQREASATAKGNADAAAEAAPPV